MPLHAPRKECMTLWPRRTPRLTSFTSTASRKRKVNYCTQQGSFAAFEVSF